ncbi:MAG: DNA oxidative demethylase AlkB [Polyangiaceae bacterium]
MTLDLFDDSLALPEREMLGERAFLLRGFAAPRAAELLEALAHIEKAAPFRHMTTPGGFEMSVALTNCGPLGWISDRERYAYSATDPSSGNPWPAMPAVLSEIARSAATEAGFGDFVPDACLVNRYVPGTRMALHQDKDESDLTAPIVSISLGIPAVFLFGGHRRKHPAARITLRHGDVVVWGGVDRLRFHGVLPMKEASHPDLGSQRINFTLRKAGK